jgi:hypothetical protein
VLAAEPGARLALVAGVPLGSSRRSLLAVALLLSTSLACARRLIELRSGPAATPPVEHLATLEVVASVAGGADPLPLQGGRLAYAGLTDATRRFIEAVARPWAEGHRARRPGGWQLLVELTRAEATLDAGRLTVEIETRVTLRGTIGQVHLGQTHGYCKTADTFTGDGSLVVTACLERLSRDLGGWLAGQSP